MQLKTKDWTRFWGKKAEPKVPERPSYDNFLKVTQDLHFRKKVQRENQGEFFKNHPKKPLVWKAQKHSGANGIIL